MIYTQELARGGCDNWRADTDSAGKRQTYNDPRNQAALAAMIGVAGCEENQTHKGSNNAQREGNFLAI